MADDLYDKLMQKLVRAKERGENYQSAKAALWADVEADPEKYLKMFFANWFNNNWTREIPERIKRKVEPTYKPYKPRPQSQTGATTKEERIGAANRLGLALMNSYLPDGETRLKDATGSQLKKCAGFFGFLANHVKGSQIAGRVLTAEQIANLWTRVHS